MKISGYGEFQQMRKMAQKDDQTLKENAERAEQEVHGDGDAVSISPEARRRGKMRQASDFREAKVADVKSRLENGTLVTDESLKSGAKKMLDNLISGDI